MKHVSPPGSPRDAMGNGRETALPPVACSVLLFLSLGLLSCASKTDRGPAITLTDFRAQNIERLHDGVIDLVGEDSAGIAAKGYIRAFEEDLAMQLPTRPAMPAPVDEPPELNLNAELAILYAPGVNQSANDRSDALIAPGADPKILELKRWLDGRKMEALRELRRQNEEFLSRRDRASAKQGLAAAYVAISCANLPNEVETITALVEPLLAGLTTP